MGVLALLIPCSGMYATVVPGLSFEQLTDESEMVISGDVVRSWSDWDSAHKFIWTHHEISVSGAHKGALARTVVVSEPGGVVGDRAMSIAGTVSYERGENVVVFLERMPNGYLRTTGWAQGKYVVDKAGRVHGMGASSDLEIVRPDGAGGKFSTAKVAATPLRTLDGMNVAQFRSRIEAHVRSRVAGGNQ